MVKMKIEYSTGLGVLLGNILIYSIIGDPYKGLFIGFIALTIYLLFYKTAKYLLKL